MGKWERIEEFLNHILTIIGNFLSRNASKATPKKIKETYSNTGKKLKDIRENADVYKQKAISQISSSKDHVIQKVAIAKEKTNTVITKAKETDYKSLEYKKMILAFCALLIIPLSKLKTWYLSLKPTTMLTIISLSTVGALSSITIYKQSQKIQDNSRTPASELVEEVDQATAISRRPAYFKKYEKQFTVTNVVLPAYLDGKSNLRKLVIDFSIESSNRYIKEYFWDNPHLIQDRLNSRIEPVSVSFPLENEGKEIIKDKIKRELNILINDLKMKGEIDDVRIHSMIGG